jgi:2-dehydro-3-deoxy-D-gluconate 5-dehydrogenase
MTSNRFDLTGRLAVVTGARRGIGRAMARALAEAGADIIGVSANLDSAGSDVEKDVTAAGRAFEGIQADFSDAAAVAALAADLAGRERPVDILVNNAGTSEVVPAEDETSAQLRGVIDVNLVAAYRLTQMCAVPMLDRGAGAIVNVSSILGLVGAGQIPQASYAASKAGLIGLTRELAAQWARRGVRVNALAPGWFPSEMTAEMTTDPEQGLNWIRTRDPMGRPGREDELDGALLFLASDASSYVTGHTLAVDGGWTIV